MHCIEYGKQHSQVMILLHGGGLSWWNWRDAAERLQASYHVILPVLDGHAQSDAPFTTIEANAQRIIDYIDRHFGGQVHLLGGLSLGGQILLEILALRPSICRYAVIESAPVIPSRLTHALIKPAFGSCYGLIRRRWFAALQFRSLRITPKLFDDYYRDTCLITRASLIAFMQANAGYAMKSSLKNTTADVFLFAGAKEQALVRRSAQLLHKTLPESRLCLLPQMYHGEFSLNHPEACADTLARIAAGKEPLPDL